MAAARAAVATAGTRAAARVAAAPVGFEAAARVAAATGEPKADASVAAATVAVTAVASVVSAMAAARAGLAEGAARVAWAGERAGMVGWVATVDLGAAGSAAWGVPTEAAGGVAARTAAVWGTGVRRGGCASAHQRRRGAPSSSRPTARPASAAGTVAWVSSGAEAGVVAERKGRAERAGSATRGNSQCSHNRAD